MRKLEIAFCVIFSVLTASVLTAKQTSQDADDIGQLKEMITKQREDFELKFQQQAQIIARQEKLIAKQRTDFEQKLQWQSDLIAEQDRLISKQRTDFEHEFQRQGELFSKFAEDLEICIRERKQQPRRGKEGRGLWQTLFENSHTQKQPKKRGDDTDPLEAVVSQVSQRLDGVTAEIASLKNVDRSLSNDIVEGRGSLYVRWGSSSCANTSQLVYTGLIGGSFYAQSSGATNQLCLPLQPEYSTHSQGSHIIQGYAGLYGGEYEVEPEPAHNLDAVCAVCRSSRATTVMIPATNTCHPGWSLEYSGYIMTDRQAAGRAGTEFICVDSAMEGRAGTKANNDGVLLYYTQSHCGSLPCPPYVEGKVVTCVVCSK